MSEFEVSVDALKEVEASLMEEFRRGLAEEGNHVVVKMHLTFVHSIPNGTEEGEFLALDFGSNKLRVGRVSEL